MITVPKKVEYSIVLLTYLVKNEGRTVSLAEVSKTMLLPYRFMGQLASALRAAGIVESREGKSGGYILAVGWKDKTLYDLLESLGENKHMVRCLSEGKECSRQANCNIRHIWDRMEHSFVSELKKIKLGEI